MAKDFGKMNNKKMEAVAKKSNESANVITVKMVGNENLIDYPKNNEDVTMTDDLELSMKQNGFTDPIEVTSFGCEDGKYMIVSGHRRRVAGVKVGITTFPCIIKNFKSDTEVYNYVLLANSQRDSAKDPLLFCKRYKMHEEYLKQSNYDGNIREEVAKRLGLSIQQADRYNQMNKIILPVWDLIRDEKVGMSSVLPMSKFFPEHQEEIVSIFNECMEQGQRLSREMCKTLIDGYKAGKNSYFDIINDCKEEMECNNSVNVNEPMGVFIDTEPTEAKEDKVVNRNDEINYDTSHREGLAGGDDKYADERLTDDDKEVIEKANKDKDKDEKPADIQCGEKILKMMGNLEKLLSEFYSFEDNGIEAINSFGKMSDLLIDNMENIAGEYEIKSEFKKQIDKLEENIKRIKTIF